MPRKKKISETMKRKKDRERKRSCKKNRVYFVYLISLLNEGKKKSVKITIPGILSYRVHTRFVTV
jgi:hypothetical protein